MERVKPTFKDTYHMVVYIKGNEGHGYAINYGLDRSVDGNKQIRMDFDLGGESIDGRLERMLFIGGFVYEEESYQTLPDADWVSFVKVEFTRYKDVSKFATIIKTIYSRCELEYDDIMYRRFFA